MGNWVTGSDETEKLFLNEGTLLEPQALPVLWLQYLKKKKNYGFKGGGRGNRAQKKMGKTTTESKHQSDFY